MPLVPCLATSLSSPVGATGAAFRARGGAWPILPICERGLEFIFDTGRGAIVNVLIARSDVAGYAQTHETSVVDIQ